MFLRKSRSSLSILLGYLAGRTDRNRNLRQAKVQNLGVPTLCHKNVRWLNVPVDNTLGMGDVEGISDLDGEGESVSMSIGRLPITCFRV